MFKRLMNKFSKKHIQSTDEKMPKPNVHPYATNDLLVEGYRLCVTMQASVPLWLLKRHGETVESIPECDFDLSPAHAVWIPMVSREFAFLDEGASMASQIGTIPDDGGDLLQYLIAAKEIIERAPDDQGNDLFETLEKLKEIRNLPMGHRYEINEEGRLTICEELIDYFPLVFRSEDQVLKQILHDVEEDIYCDLNKKKINQLIKLGYRTIASILEHQDEESFPN